MILLSSILDKAEEQERCCLFAMIIANKIVNREAFKWTISRIWKTEGWIQYYEVGENRYLNSLVAAMGATSGHVTLSI